METPEYIESLRARWRLVAACTLIGLLLGALVAVASPRVFTATAQLFISISYYGGDKGSPLAGINSTSDFALAQVQSYARVATSPQVIGPAERTLGRRIDSGRIQASNPPNTVIIEVSASGDTAAAVAAEANAISSQMAQYIPRVATRLPDGSPSVRATTIQPARPPSEQASPNIKIDLAVGLLAGITGGLGLALILGQAGIGRSDPAVQRDSSGAQRSQDGT